MKICERVHIPSLTSSLNTTLQPHCPSCCPFSVPDLFLPQDPCTYSNPIPASSALSAYLHRAGMSHLSSLVRESSSRETSLNSPAKVALHLPHPPYILYPNYPVLFSSGHLSLSELITFTCLYLDCLFSLLELKPSKSRDLLTPEFPGSRTGPGT